MNVSDNDSSIQRDDKGIVHFDQSVIERQDAQPVGRFVILHRAMAGSDGSLKMILAGFVAEGGLHKVIQAASNHCLIPLRSVLLLETKDVAITIKARQQARAV